MKTDHSATESSLRVLAVLSVALFSCGGGSSPPPSTPSAATSSSAGSAEQAPPASPSSSASEPATAGESPSQTKPAGEKPSKPEGGGEKATRRPRDLLSQPGVVYMLAFEDSEPKKAAEQACGHKATGNTAKVTTCMERAREKIGQDGFRFEQDKKGEWQVVVLRKKGNTLIATHKLHFKFAEEHDKSAVIKFEGKDAGATPGKFPPHLRLDFQNDYEFVIKDPKHGKLVYKSKMEGGS
jgi:hypothetical protein